MERGAERRTKTLQISFRTSRTGTSPSKYIRDEDISVDNVFLEVGIGSFLVARDDELEALLLCPVFEPEGILGRTE